MSIAESFYNYVSNNSTITAVLGSSSGIFPETVPQNYSAFPALTYSLAEDQDIGLLNGGKSDTSRAVIQVNVYATSFKTVNDIATVLKAQLVGYRGTFGSHTADHIRKEEGGEITLPPEPDTGLYGVRLSFQISYY